MIFRLFNPLSLFKSLYAKFYVWFTFFLVNWATKRVRKLMCKIGKNPDHEVPPPPPPPPPKWDEADINRARMAVVGKYQSYVKNPAEHPVLRSRSAFEERQKKAKTPEVTETPQAPLAPTIIEVGSGAIEDTREAIHSVEESVKSEKKERE